jgi:hypothetical protein
LTNGNEMIYANQKIFTEKWFLKKIDEFAKKMNSYEKYHDITDKLKPEDY